MIAEDGAQLGVMSPQEALRMARERGYDLVEVAPQASPPVCRIMDFNKFRYDQAKREREAKKKRHLARFKELKFKPHIEAHDYQVKLQQLKRFLLRGDKVKVTVVFRGRELGHLDLGRRILERLRQDLQSIVRIERNLLIEGRFMTMVFSADPAAIKRADKEAARAAQAKRATASSGKTAAPEPSERIGKPESAHAKTQNT